MLDAEAAEESRSGRELAALLGARLDAARHASEKLLGVLQVSLAQHADSYVPQRAGLVTGACRHQVRCN